MRLGKDGRVVDGSLLEEVLSVEDDGEGQGWEHMGIGFDDVDVAGWLENEGGVEPGG